MSKIMSKTLRVAFAAAALCAASSTADAKPRSVVILDFDGPRKLADSGHGAVVGMLGDQYDIVNTKRWEKARSDAARTTHGPATWGKAARAASVDAVIEGWVQDEGRRHVLTIVVREASTGNEVDQTSIKLDDKGITPDATKQLATNLEEILEYVNIDGGDIGTHRLPPASVPRKMIGARAGKDEDRVKAVDDDDSVNTTRSRKHADDDAPPADDSRRRRTKARDDDDDSTSTPRRRTHRDDSSALDDRRDTRVADVSPAPILDDKKIIVASATPPDDNAKQTRDDLVDLFPTPSRERDIILDKQAPHKPVPTPRFLVSGGLYLYSRQLEFTATGDQTGPMEYVGTQVQGLQVNAAVYPWPIQKTDGRMSGLGFSVLFGKAIGSYYTFDDGDNTADYTIDQSTFEAKIHYRYPIDSFTIDSHVGYGRSNHVIQDAPEVLEVPDVSYEWLSAGVELELAITDRATVALGGQYLKLIGDGGDLNSEDWYGSGSASGLEVHGGFVVPLPANLFVKGVLSYRRITTNFNGDGVLTQMWGVVDATDTNVGAAVDVGIQF